MPRHRYKGQPIPKATPDEDLAKAFADMAKLNVESVSLQLGMPVVRFLANLLRNYVEVSAEIKARSDAATAEQAKQAEEEKPQ